MMRAMMRTFLLFGLLLGCLPARAQEQRSRVAEAAALHHVQKIYIADMGDGDSAERFRLLLEDQLLRKGFTTVLRESQADAVLGGVLSLPPFDDSEGNARVTVQMRSPASGTLLWTGNFGPKLTGFFRFKDPLKILAEAMANRLRKDWEQSAKNSGARKTD